MPQLNELGEYGLNQLIARRLTTPGPAPSPTVEPALFPSLVLESDRPEWEYLKGVRLCSARSARANVAGQNSLFGLTNPAGSGMIVVVQRTIFTPGASTVLVKLSAQAVTGAPVTPTVRDSRWSQGTSLRGPTAQVNVGNAVGLAPEPPIAWGNSAVTTEVRDPIILTPGWTLRIEVATVTIDLVNGEMHWLERTAQPGEI